MPGPREQWLGSGYCRAGPMPPTVLGGQTAGAKETFTAELTPKASQAEDSAWLQNQYRISFL